MDNEKAKELMLKYNSGELLGSEEERLLEEYIEQGIIQIEELSDLDQLKKGVAKIETPAPSDQLNAGFYKMLGEEKAMASKSFNLNEVINGWIERLGLSKGFVRLAYSLTLIIGGLAVGFLMNQGKTKEIQTLSAEMKEMREMMMLTLLEKESISDRLRAVSMTDEVGVNEKVVEALLQTLNNDDNVNVRLATIEGLYQYADNPKVREGLIQAITHQDSPLVQMALAEVMVALQEKRSVDELKEILKKENTPQEVKDKIEESIETLI
ncbi:MAG: HEAT repeat domain-containing protein [Bacteroidota bacterium]